VTAPCSGPGDHRQEIMEEVVSEELKPCPFCGGEAKLISHTSTTVQCQNDQCIGDPSPFNGALHRSDAITTWNTRAADAELATLRAQNAHWENVARAINAKLGVALEAVIAVVSATRQYLPPDGISQHECISLVLEATDNPRINQLVLAEEARNALAQVAK